MHTAKRPALRRLFEIDRQLRAGAYPTAKRLAAQLDTSAKTIHRDLNYLRDQYGAPVDYCPVRKGWMYREPTYRLPAVLITQGELLAIFVAGQAMRQAAGSPFADALQAAARKLAELLPDEISIAWENVQKAHSFRNSAVSEQDAAIYLGLTDAVQRKRQVRIRYWTASRNAESLRVVDPWHLHTMDGQAYLVGWCHQRRRMLTFAANRIRHLEETGETFRVPDDFSASEFFASAFRVMLDDKSRRQPVRLRFAPSAARYVREKTWHATQRVLADDGESLELEFMLGSLVEVRRWVLSWGAECEVLEPVELKDDIAREATRMAARYRRERALKRLESPVADKRKPRVRKSG